MAPQVTWVKTNTPPKNRLSKYQKLDILRRAQHFTEEHYKAQLAPPPKKRPFNYIIDYLVKWRGSYLYFIAKYACPGPNALSPQFDHMFARLGCFTKDRFNLWARRHNDEWIVLDEALTLEQCFERMADDPWFQQ